MEVTVTFNELLKARSASTCRGALPDFDRIDGYLKEAFSVNRDIVNLHNELSHIRQAYLSTAAPRKTQIRRAGTGSHHHHQDKPVYLTDADRNAVDKMAKESLQRLEMRIRILEDEEARRHDAAEKVIKKKYGGGLRALTSWAAGGALGAGDDGAKSPEHAEAVQTERQILVHRGTIIGYLREKLNAISKLQAGMMETRLSREMEKNRSILAKARGSQLPPALAKEFGFDSSSSGPSSKPSGSGVPLDEEESQRRQAQDLDLTDEQQQMFEKDNQDMLKHYNSALDKVRTVEKSIMEISELQQMLAENLTMQSAHIDQLVADAERTEENVGGGNKELKKATQRKFSQARLTFYAASALCTFLVVWDLII
ncbi:Syntaxin UFE1 [Cytospora mali]|uniref:Syntaxin UFE1 n=1 Tax=Cytospora mali TaxID=578113 RepID=A0A194VXW2_CYTMA|nr:Syntaxin UFE1 [Valsa mali]